MLSVRYQILACSFAKIKKTCCFIGRFPDVDPTESDVLKEDV